MTMLDAASPGPHARATRSGPARRGLLADPWTRLGLLGSTLACGVIGIHVPASLWAGNLEEFHSAFIAFLALGVMLCVAAGAVMLVLCWLLPRPLRAALASAIAAVGIACWVHASFLGGRMELLNGLDAPISFETRLGTWEMPIVIGACLLLALLIGLARRLATPMLTMLNIGLFALTLVGIFTAGRTPLRGVATEIGSTFQFSARGNVLVLLLDSLQSDIADTALRGDPALAAAFDGFAFYKDTLGVAPTTLITMPAVHSGAVYDGKAPIADYFANAITHQSFLTRFVDAGYRAASVEPLRGLCPDRVGACPGTDALVRTRRERITREAVRLLDLSLFRVAPVALKRAIYADGNWLVAQTFLRPFDFERLLDGHHLLDRLGERLVVDEGPPTIKFVHLFTTHGPFRVLEDCRSFAPVHHPRHIATQARCGLASVAALFERMKAKGVYDSTVILVMADHGFGIDNGYDAHRQETPSEWRLRTAGANPVFLLKPRDARGPLHDAPGAVHLTDVGATLCVVSGACEASPRTFAAGEASPGRVRRYNDYEWKHEYWLMREPPAIMPYEVLGPVWERGSWRTATPKAPYRLGDPIPLKASTDDRYLQAGWARPEPWGRWTTGRVAQLAMHLESAPPADEDLQLVARAWALLPRRAAAQQATWVVNGHALDTWRFEPGNTLDTHRLRIPRSVLTEDGDLRIALRISDPVSPRELKMGDDPRPLGLAFADLSLVAAPAEAADEASGTTAPAVLPPAVSTTNGGGAAGGSRD